MGPAGPVESKCWPLWLGSTILGLAPGTLPPHISFSLGVRQLGGRGPPAQLLQPGSLGAGWGGLGQPGILISGPGPPSRSLRTNRKDPAVCVCGGGGQGLEQCGALGLGSGFLLLGPLSSLSDGK